MSERFESRFKPIIVMFVLIGLLIVGKAANLQLFDNTFKDRGNAAAIEKAITYPERGLVYDRNGLLLVYNTLVYDLMVTYNSLSPEMDTAKFCELLDIDRLYFKENIVKDWTSGRYSKNIPFVFMKKIDPEIFARFQEHMHEFAGFTVQRRNARIYPHANAASLLGYIREVDQEQIDGSEGLYRMGDYVGASGLEKTYEQMIKGSKGIEYILKDNKGRRVGPYKDGSLDSLPVSGFDLFSGLDLELQTYGEQLLQNKIGSVVAIDPQTGEILSMITAPSYDPNSLTIDRSRGEAYTQLLQDTLKPLFDRALMARYPPGSIFKTVLSLIAMQEGILDPGRSMTCNGGYHIGKYRWGCRSHPFPRDVPTALQYSCNTYYYQLFRDLVDRYGTRKVGRGLDTLHNQLRLFGLGNKLDIDLPGEIKGYIPNSALYDKMYGKNRWRSTAIISLGIGQGELQLNTLQMANLAAIIANRGSYIVPHVINRIRDTTGKIENLTHDRIFCGVDPVHYEPVIEGMNRVVSPNSAAFIDDIMVCGKTGTSQNPHGEDHSVFIAFAPRDNPKIAIAVYVENSGFGGRYAAPIASLMIEKYLTRTIRPQRAHIEKRMLDADLIGRNKIIAELQ
jgi:penicillin-binding protein 2